MPPPVLHSVLLMVPNAARAAAFYGGALGLPKLAAAPGWLRMSLGTADLFVKEAPAPHEQVPSKQAPVLQLRVSSSSFDELLPALLSAGGTLEVPVVFALAGRLCVLRAPVDAGGHLFSLRASDTDEEFIVSSGGSTSGGGTGDVGGS